MKKWSKRLIFVFLYTSLTAFCATPIELELWHAMAGSLGREVNALAEQFNGSQNDYRIKPIYKGNYIETFTSFVAAFRAQKAPAMVQIFEVGTPIMQASKGVVRSLEELMQEHGMPLSKADFFPSMRLFYSKENKLMALPFNLSIPIMYYNKEVLAKIGYSNKNFPRTWDEFEGLASRLKNEGFDCVYTTAYPGWILWESFLALHGLSMPLNKAEEKIMLQHLQRLKLWQKKRYFRYAGRDDDATVLFTGGVCPLFSQSSGANNSLKRLVPFQMGTALIPFDNHLSAIRHSNVTGGAALWAIAGLNQTQYLGIAKFYSFLLRPEIQQKWQQHTGYLPIGLQGQYAFLLQGNSHANLLLAQEDLKSSSEVNSFYKGPSNQIRSVNEAILESLFTGILSPEQALTSSVLQENRVRKRFFKQHP